MMTLPMSLAQILCMNYCKTKPLTGAFSIRILLFLLYRYQKDEGVKLTATCVPQGVQAVISVPCSSQQSRCDSLGSCSCGEQLSLLPSHPPIFFFLRLSFQSCPLSINSLRWMSLIEKEQKTNRYRVTLLIRAEFEFPLLVSSALIKHRVLMALCEMR